MTASSLSLIFGTSWVSTRPRIHVRHYRSPPTVSALAAPIDLPDWRESLYRVAAPGGADPRPPWPAPQVNPDPTSFRPHPEGVVD
ncbi:hypothetical protein Acsp04_50650 [Actinomadura sp. NBRC 104425]|nr:hypothetical protein Acsp04_50650 [Actinomadura sp. NBRC 104425]